MRVNVYADRVALLAEMLAARDEIERLKGQLRAAREEIGRLTKECDHRLGELNQVQSSSWMGADQLAKQVERLRDALTDYGKHLATCAIHARTMEQINANFWPECTCGLAAAEKPSCSCGRHHRLRDGGLAEAIEAT